MGDEEELESVFGKSNSKQGNTAEDGIYKEMYARIIAFNLIHWLILKASKKHQKDPERISTS